MGKKTDHIAPHIATFIKNQHIFFVGTAATEGRVNISPKGTDSFRVINKNKIVWLNLTGSGNETAAHLLQNNRMTIMFCAFEGKPLILRLYGNATIFHPRDEAFQKHSALFPDAVGSRQIIEMNIDLVQTSCGFGVPFMDYSSERTTLDDWANQKGQDGIEQYWIDKNTKSIDGFETQISK
ncbi:pyridoxamine 5'-phosphate oxidase family protein [uncultured Formosa sp.]|uniref:pyridoxamine 5'-phosphate oxidase family protein n=1 Tax=uncultured Formosa sp. TaxID=255435 RepID=UPI00262A9DE8|nr:pyridoxamine 5'-phosphate oxidase family protein [uncultured Formosa sp.]